MTLRKFPLVQVPALEMTPSPYDGIRLLTDKLTLMHHWMAGYWEVGDAFPDFTFAEALKVHRVIADSWLAGLKKAGHISSYAFSRGNNTEVFAPGFVINPINGPVKEVNLRMGDLQLYDPWVDRKFDHDLPDAIYPDFYIDKYFDVFINEYYLAYGYLRKRPNGKIFQPLDLTEHPRHADIAETKRISGTVAKEEWRQLIDDLACT